MSLRVLCLLAVILLSAGCVGSGVGFSPVPPFSPPPGEPWALPEDAWPTQRLFRMRYEGKDGKASLKLTLYLESERSFRMRAADSLGRKVWELEVDENDEALWLDHRGKQYCKARSAGRLAIVPLAYMPLKSLPQLLLGRLPAEPARNLDRTPSGLRFEDLRGQIWNGGLEDGKLAWWTRTDDGEAVAWWRRDDGDDVFIDLVTERQLRWREVVRERLVDFPPPLKIPNSFREGACG